jgi:tetratricopeptide (TPR) repeat protein
MFTRHRMLTLLIASLSTAAAGALWSWREAPPAKDSLAIVLAAKVSGDDAQAREIRRLQEALRAGGRPQLLERLAWSFVARARSEEDPGFTKLAEHAARALEAQVPGDAGARLVLGHALLALHRFAEAEVVARALASERGAPMDHGLLGDALLEQGRLAEAASSYQAMMDLRPDAHAYARTAHLRWLSGDPEGALAAMRVAARAVSPRNAESFAWMWAQLALHELRAGDYAAAERSCAAALAVAPGSANALEVEGRLRLAQGRSRDALDPLRRAAERSPLPERLWAYADALRDTEHGAEADQVEQRILATGEGADPRGLAIFLASHHREPQRALALARRELEAREDVFTLAAAALAQTRAGDAERGWRLMQRALETGTPDARLQLQAGLVAQAAGRRGEAAGWLRAAERRRPLLLPSERRELELALTALDGRAQPGTHTGGRS